MKALLLSAYKQLDLVDMPAPTPAVDELLIRIKACGICGSDVHGYDGSTGRRIPPIVMGHEAAGIVESVGSAVTSFRPGDRVTFDSTVYCGKCFFCLRGQANLCDNREVIGVSTPAFRRMGAFAEFVTVPARIAYPLPDNMPFTHAAMIEAVSVAVHAVSLTPIALDDSVVVVGAGMIGLLTLQAARQAGAGKVIVLDIDDARLELARSLGATHTLNSRDADVVPQNHPIDSRARRGRGIRVCRLNHSSEAGLRLREKRRHCNLSGQHRAHHRTRTPIGSYSPDSNARLLRIFRRVSRVHLDDRPRRHSD